MRILVFNAGRFDTPEGGAVRAKQLFVYPKNLKAVRNVEADVAVFYNAWGTHLARKNLRKRGVPVVFDYTDFMHEFRSNVFEKKIARFATARALKKADAVVATAKVLVEDARKFNKNTYFVPNGVDFGAFQKVRPKQLEHPAVGFVGGFGKWVDFSLFDFDADAHFYFVGDGPSAKNLPKKENVHHVGFKPPEEARAYMAAFDVCTIPFTKNVLTDAVCPIKLFEYWASGKPVLSTPLEEVKNLNNGGVVFGSTRAEWTEALKSLLADSSKRERLAQSGFEESKKFDWKRLAEKMDGVLQNVEENREKRH
ncbi:glycosyltransferase [Candidatus Micrarchaeota archaeon]|nr:glycosyltransferase [Candidatus Micrarchaeota archaeon]